jgi:voltage-gated potassium channel
MPDPTTADRRSRLAGATERARSVQRSNLFERRMTKFLREPPSIRNAAGVIVTATALIVVGAGVLMRVLDHEEYANVWVGMWWALQTVTTVGYGDVTPARVVGRVIGAVVMLEGIAFLAIVTAAITSTFVARAERERVGEEGGQRRQLDDIAERLDRIESTLGELARGRGSPTAE